VVGWIVQSLVFKWYVTSIASFESATGTLVAFIFVTTYFAVAAVVLLVGLGIDEVLRKDARGGRRSLVGLVPELF
jgi:uncharacterized BrkB/YihY/UPF0761 family membrane protein